MSRIGKKPVPVPAGVKVAIDAATRKIDLSGPKGSLSLVHRPEVSVAFDEAQKRLVCSIPERSMEDGQVRAYWGLTRALLDNMVEGVTKGYERKLDIVGVGWQAKLQGKNLILNVGYADPVTLAVPDGLKVEVSNGIQIAISGPDRQLVGQFAAAVRSKRKPEPYNGKGIKYNDEVIQRKQGKAFGS
ncbi:MAG TPA: 50S ribosomal protein L6 [Phycisphaerales bacterium]|nr:50S ribosomal protein L6 [Phycisphaerales bacterium]HMP36426.1 50S ribosomal protein L6 [Phycisphaerales bacterium]